MAKVEASLGQRLDNLNKNENVRRAYIDQNTRHLIAKLENPWNYTTVWVDMTAVEEQAKRNRFRLPIWWPR